MKQCRCVRVNETSMYGYVDLTQKVISSHRSANVAIDSNPISQRSGETYPSKGSVHRHSHDCRHQFTNNRHINSTDLLNYTSASFNTTEPLIWTGGCTNNQHTESVYLHKLTHTYITTTRNTRAFGWTYLIEVLHSVDNTVLNLVLVQVRRTEGALLHGSKGETSVKLHAHRGSELGGKLTKHGSGACG